MNILITGVSGLVGQEIVKQLLEDVSINITGIVHKERIEGIKTFQADVQDYDALESIFKEEKYDVVLHMAAISDYLSSTDKKYETFKVNMHGTMNVLELFNKYCRNALFIFTSSCKVYGSTDEMPISEKAKANPLTVVGKSKFISERIVQFYVEDQNKYLIVRPFNIYGSKQKENFLMPTLIKQLKESCILQLGNVYDKRDYIYVKDVAAAIVACIKNQQKLEHYECLNIGSEQANSVEDILKIMEDLLGKKIVVQVDQSKLRSDETSIECADCTRIKDITGWRPQYTLEGAIKEIFRLEQLIK